MIMPILGAKAVSSRSRRKSLADALFTKTQQRVMRVLFGQPERSFYASELIRDAGTGSGAAQRELARLEESGLIVARRIGHQKHYQANAASPLSSELRNIVLKTVGLAEPLRDALKHRTLSYMFYEPRSPCRRPYAPPSCTVRWPRQPTKRRATST